MAEDKNKLMIEEQLQEEQLDNVSGGGKPGPPPDNENGARKPGPPPNTNLF